MDWREEEEMYHRQMIEELYAPLPKVTDAEIEAILASLDNQVTGHDQIAKARKGKHEKHVAFWTPWQVHYKSLLPTMSKTQARLTVLELMNKSGIDRSYRTLERNLN